MESMVMGILLLPKGPNLAGISAPWKTLSEPHLGHFPFFTLAPPLTTGQLKRGLDQNFFCNGNSIREEREQGQG